MSFALQAEVGEASNGKDIIRRNGHFLRIDRNRRRDSDCDRGRDDGDAGSHRQTARGASVTMQNEAQVLPAARQARGMAGSAQAATDLPSGAYLTARLRAGEATDQR